MTFGDCPEQFILSPDQGLKLLCLASLLKDGDISFRGHEQDDCDNATDIIADIGQEIALQVGALGGGDG